MPRFLKVPGNFLSRGIITYTYFLKFADFWDSSETCVTSRGTSILVVAQSPVLFLQGLCILRNIRRGKDFRCWQGNSTRALPTLPRGHYFLLSFHPRHQPHFPCFPGGEGVMGKWGWKGVRGGSVVRNMV
jgi:hypothetical protein